MWGISMEIIEVVGVDKGLGREYVEWGEKYFGWRFE